MNTKKPSTKKREDKLVYIPRPKCTSDRSVEDARKLPNEIYHSSENRTEIKSKMNKLDVSNNKLDALKDYQHSKSIYDVTIGTVLNVNQRDVKKISSTALNRIYSINKYTPPNSAYNITKLNGNANEWIPRNTFTGNTKCEGDIKIATDFKDIHKEADAMINKVSYERGDYKENEYIRNGLVKNKYIEPPRALIGSYNFPIRPLIQPKPVCGKPSNMLYSPRCLIIDSNKTKDSFIADRNRKSNQGKDNLQSQKLISSEGEVENKIAPDDIFPCNNGKLNSEAIGMVGFSNFIPQFTDKRSTKNSKYCYVNDAKNSEPAKKLANDDNATLDYMSDGLIWGKADSENDNSDTFHTGIQDDLAKYLGGSHRLHTSRFYDISEKRTEMDDDAIVEYEGTDSESESTSTMKPTAKNKISLTRSDTSTLKKSFPDKKFSKVKTAKSFPETTYSAVAPGSMINVNHSFNSENCPVDDGSNQIQPTLLTPDFFLQ